MDASGCGEWLKLATFRWLWRCGETGCDSVAKHCYRRHSERGKGRHRSCGGRRAGVGTSRGEATTVRPSSGRVAETSPTPLTADIAAAAPPGKSVARAAPERRRRRRELHHHRRPTTSGVGPSRPGGNRDGHLCSTRIQRRRSLRRSAVHVRAVAVPEVRGLQLRRLDQAEGGDRDGGGRRAGRPPAAGVDPGRVLVREPGRGAEHDRGEQGLRLPLRDRPPLQPHDPAADGGAGQPGAHRRRAQPDRRLARRPDRLRPHAVRVRRRGTCGSTSTRTRTTGGRTTARPRRRSPASSRAWTCCSSAPAPPAR